ncbi:MAG: response regulator [Verrucomicrobia subdivision 3 bacterium]|nr:response regulator [Limisphaerales bacterium]
MKRILIIEDDPVVARVYSNSLQNAGYAVEAADDGQSGLERLRQSPPDAVLLDMMLPKINGVEILRQIRADPALQTIPVMVYTNAFVDVMIQTAKNSGATEVFNKSTLTPAALVEAFRKSMGD